jgi:hypothetical protein
VTLAALLSTTSTSTRLKRWAWKKIVSENSQHLPTEHRRLVLYNFYNFYINVFGGVAGKYLEIELHEHNCSEPLNFVDGLILLFVLVWIG